MAKYVRRDIAISEIQKFANPDDHEIITVEEVYETAIAAVDCAPAADVVEVVRCKDCKKWTREHTCEEFKSDRLATGGRTVFMTEPIDFCSYGERRDAE